MKKALLILGLLMLGLCGCVTLSIGQHIYNLLPRMWEYNPQITRIEKTCNICGDKWTEYPGQGTLVYSNEINVDMCRDCQEKYVVEFMNIKQEFDEKYNKKREKLIAECKIKEKDKIVEREQLAKSQRLRDIINNKEIENTRQNLEKLIEEKEQIEKEGIKPAEERYFTIDSIMGSTITFHGCIVLSSETKKQEVK